MNELARLLSAVWSYRQDRQSRCPTKWSAGYQLKTTFLKYLLCSGALMHHEFAVYRQTRSKHSINLKRTFPDGSIIISASNCIRYQKLLIRGQI